MTMRMRRTARLAAAALIAIGSAAVEARVQPEEPRARGARAATAYIEAAIAFQRVDAQFMQRLADRGAPLPEGIDADSEEWRRWTLADPRALRNLNTDFDRATFAFFGGDLPAVVQGMNAMLVERPGSGRDFAFLEFARSIRVEVDPPRPAIRELDPVGTAPIHLRLRLTSIYPLPAGTAPPDEFAAVLRHGDGAVHVAASARMNEFRQFDERISLTIEAPVARGRREILLRSGPLRAVIEDAQPRTFELIGSWTVLDEPLAATRERLAPRLARLAEQGPGGAHPLAQRLLRERAALLDRADAQADPTAMLTDYAQLAADLDRECAAVEVGVNPYMGRSGDCWHALPLAEDLSLPARIFVPESALAKDAMPLLIALHGAGGNEHLFMEAYGAGAIRRLAQEHGFAVVSPLAAPMMDLGLAFDTIVDAMEQLYSIDESRIYVIGHSLGAALTGGMCSVRGERIAAACWLAGASYARASRLPPTLVIAAELDSIVPPARIEPAVKLAQNAGLDVEYRVVPDFGHTLVVGYALGDVVEWLLARRLH